MPFGDNPMDRIKVGQSIYMDMLSRATESVCIMTPYLILDSDLENKLRYTAARGVQVRLMLPGIPDKYIPYALAKTHYKRLLEAGVQIYEYSPGFVHAKVVVIDAREAVVGTINFDYRSFCHHFECGTYMYGCSCIPSIMVDFENCVSESRLVTNETVKAEKWHRKLAGYLLKGLAPLL
jgi:cardiolipin synthase